MAINIKRLYKSTIEEINNMYLDDADFEGIVFWNNDAIEYCKQIESQA